MDKEKRLKNLSKFARRIAEFAADDEHSDIKLVVKEAAKEYGCSESDIELEGVDYPEDIIW